MGLLRHPSTRRGLLLQCRPCLPCSPCHSWHPARGRGRAETQSPGAKALLGQSSSCNALSSSAVSPSALSRTPESHSSRQACFPLRGLQLSSWNTDQEAELWASRVNFQKPAYSDPRPAGGLPQKSHQGLLLAENPAGTWGAHRQTGPAKAQEAESVQPREVSPPPETQLCRQTHSQTETQTYLQLKGSQELRLQALRARIQSRQAKQGKARTSTN